MSDALIIELTWREREKKMNKNKKYMYSAGYGGTITEKEGTF